MAMLEEAALVIRDLAEGGSTGYEGAWLELDWAPKFDVPLWIAGYGPKAMELAGRIGDGIMIQLADPALVRHFVSQVHDAAGRAGRDPAAIRVMAAAPAHIGDLELCRERTRWFPALVSNHVVDLASRYAPSELPAAFTGYVRDRTGYDYQHHAEVGSSNAAFVGDEVTDRFCILGSAEDHVRKLRELADAGVTQFNFYLMNGDEEEMLDAYARDVIPALTDATAARA
jgi:alkanesulfonate monooxygenase SsuD/methylene tetrahydromethanopterin reductase-like flavin-dependent oxidoreductase (luciferase family)